MRPAIYAELERRGVTLHLEGDHLLYQAPKGKMNPLLLAELKRVKPHLLAYMRAKAAQRQSALDLVIECFDGELVDLDESLGAVRAEPGGR